ncbi:uncharacterized protein LOC132204418 [Neocloeon triangulifer]|uniref:uncharacterized protein LOC132204418 n=1 Tax=Neocloeon triangulifer TaxID=2078957 RepID=UPI00286EB699|nr:uncharacterized protein LOC132204418 [Neocloeon triangulifer]
MSDFNVQEESSTLLHNIPVQCFMNEYDSQEDAAANSTLYSTNSDYKREMKPSLHPRIGENAAPNLTRRPKTNVMPRVPCKLCPYFYRSPASHFNSVRRSCRNCKRRFECKGLCHQHELICCDFLKCKSCGKHLCSSNSRLVHTKKRTCVHCSQVIECCVQFKHHVCPEQVQSSKSEEPEQPEPPRIEPGPDEMDLQCRFCLFLCKDRDVYECHTRQTDCPRCGFAQPCNALLAQHLNMCHCRKDKKPEKNVNKSLSEIVKNEPVEIITIDDE